MTSVEHAIRSMIRISDQELAAFLEGTTVEHYAKRDLLHKAGRVAHTIFFIQKGLLQVTILDASGKEHTLHFAQAGEFITDYSSFLLQQPALCSLQALEPTEVIAIPRSRIEYGYTHLREGDRLGRLIAEYYFIYHDRRIQDRYAYTAKERYDRLEEYFPGLLMRVPQYLIASYLGITPIHLSRLKKNALYDAQQ